MISLGSRYLLLNIKIRNTVQWLTSRLSRPFWELGSGCDLLLGVLVGEGTWDPLSTEVLSTGVGGELEDGTLVDRWEVGKELRVLSTSKAWMLNCPDLQR